MRVINKPELWKVIHLGNFISEIQIGYDKNTNSNFIANIPNHLYNKIIKGLLRVDYIHEYKKDEYDRAYLSLINIKTNKIIKQIKL